MLAQTVRSLGKVLVILAFHSLAAFATDRPPAFSFIRDAQAHWNRKLPVTWITEKDGGKILRLEGSDNYNQIGKVDISAGKALERFRGHEIEFVLEFRLENVKLRQNQWAKNRKEDFQPVVWHWEHANCEWSSWVKPPLAVPASGTSDGWQTRRFRTCVEPDDELGKAGVILQATCAAGGVLYIKDFWVEAAPDKFMDKICAAAKIPENYRCEYSPRWQDGKKWRGIVAQWSFKPADFEKIASWGCNLVRMSRFRPLADDYGKLQANLDVLKKHGIRVIFAPMAPGGKGNRNKYAVFNNDQMREDFLKGWEKLAAHFKGRDDVWAFGLLNEPFQGLFGNNSDKFNYWELEWEAIRRIRALDPERPIVATADFGGGPGDYRLPYMRPFPAKDIWYELHFYSPLALTHYGVLGKRMDIAKQSYPGMKLYGSTPWDKAMLARVFADSRFFAERWGARYFVGEFSVMRCVPGAAKWLEDVCDIIDRNVNLWTYHSYGEYHGWNLEYDEKTPYEKKAQKMPAGQDSARMQVLKKYWARNR